MRPRPRHLALILALAALLGACGMMGGGEDERGALRVAVLDNGDAGAPGLDPIATLPLAATRAGLLRLDARGGITAGLARSWAVSPDGLQYVFRLRKGAHWSDGKPITATSAATALARMMSRREHSPFDRLLAPVEDVGAPAPDVVEVRLSRAQPSLLAVFAHPAMGLADRARFAAGPFLPPRKGQTALTANPDYYAAKDLRLGTLTLQPMAAPDAVAAFAKDNVDVVTGGMLSGLLAARDAAGRGTALHVEPALGYVAVEFGADAGSLTDPRLREAMSRAVNRAGLAQPLFATPLIREQLGLIPAIMAGPSPVLPAWAGLAPQEQLASAVALAAAAQISPARPLTLTLDMPEGPEMGAIASALATAWEPLGIIVRARVRPAAAHRAFVLKGQFQIALTERTAPAPAWSWFIDPLRCANSEQWRCSPEADAAFDRYVSTGDLAARLDAERLLQTQTPVIPLFTTIRWHLVSPSVAGWQDNPAGAHPLSALSVGGARSTGG